MTAILHKIEDPRSWVAKMTRKELEYLGIKEGRNFPNGMPAELMKSDFLLNPPVQKPRPLSGSLGQTGVGKRIPPYKDWLVVAFREQMTSYSEQASVEVDHMNFLKKQWEQQSLMTMIDYEEMSFKEVRDQARSIGIKIDRKDNKQSLIDKINGKNTP